MSIVSSRRRRRDVRASANGQPAAAQHHTNDRPDWPDWRQTLAERRRDRPLPDAGKNKHALLWGLDDLLAEMPAASLDLITRLAKAEAASPPSRLLSRLWSAHCGFANLDGPLAALMPLAWSRNLADLADVVDEQAWRKLADDLGEISRQTPQAATAGLLNGQLLLELRLTLAHWFDERPGAADARSCVSSLEEALLAEIDDDGLVREVPRQQWLPLLACWTRCRSLLQNAGLGLRADAAGHYQDFVEALLRLAGHDGSLAWPGQEQIQHQQLDLWRAAAAFVHPRLTRAMNSLWQKRPARARPAARRTAAADLPPSAGRSEQAAFAVLRPNWSAPRLIVDYATEHVRLRLDRGGSDWLTGDCPVRVALDGRPLTRQSDWEELCWISDDDIDYLELQLELDESVRIQRHILFARQDEIILLADAVLGARPAALSYETVLPLGAAMSVEAAAETRELTLTAGGRRRARVLPLALGEWQTERGRGELAAGPDGLRLTQVARQAANLFAPWFIDVSDKRLRRPVTWRRLTVAEERQTQTDDAAVGYRVQIGEQQWLFYRSLIACGNRTLLGHNLVSEFLAARFSRKGVPETLIEIEAPAYDQQ